MKKIIAWISVTTLLITLSTFNVSAAAINGSTAVASGFATSSTITVTNTAAFPDGDEIATASIKNIDGTIAGGTNSATLTIGGDNADANTSVLTIATEAVINNSAYIVHFTTTSGDFGSVFVSVWTPTNNTTIVTATVEPVLTMTLVNTAIDLGILSSSAQANSATDTQVIVQTNANGWYSLFASASTFIGAATSNVISFVSANTQVTGTEWFSLDVATLAQGANGGWTVAAIAWFDGATSSSTISTSAQAIASSAGTTDGDQIDVNYSANISSVTEADSYATTVIYTVTGSF